MSLPLSLYRLATGLAEPLVGSILRGRARRGKEDPARLSERLGRTQTPRPDGPLVWLHGASVGESLSVLPLIERLRAERPDIALLVTSGTVTSAELLAARLPPGVIHQYVPVDTPRAAARFLAHWKPQLAVFIESELWPNLLLQAKASGAKLALLSARITEDSARGWLKAPKSIRTLLRAFDLVMPQDEASDGRLEALGAHTDGLLNLKFVAAPLPVDAAECAELEAAIGERQVVLAASTHPGEEELVAQAVMALPDRPLLIVAPRHPERGHEVVAALRALGLRTAQRWMGEPLEPDTEAYVADTLGEMGLLYANADVAVMGGAFAEGIGGHNPLEPARAGVAVITGPHAFNFAGVYADLLAQGAALEAAGAEDLARHLAALLADLDEADRMGQAGQAYARSRNTVLDAAWVKLQPLLPR